MKKLKTILLSLFVLATTLSSAQAIIPTGTIAPLSNTVITSLCNFTLGATFNKGIQSTSVVLSLTKNISGSIGLIYAQSVAFPSTYSASSIDTANIDFSYTTYEGYTLTSGINYVYLLLNHDNSVYVVSDSVQINVINPMITYYASFTPTFLNSTTLDVEVTLEPLDPMQTYTIGVYSPVNSAYNTVVLPQNSTSYSYSFTANNNTDYYFSAFPLEGTCPLQGGPIKTYSILSTPLSIGSPTCPIYVDGLFPTNLPSNSFCVNDTVQYPYILNASGLQPNEVITINANFGDGTGIKTTTVISNSNGSYNNNNAINLFNHYYTAPGAYSLNAWATAPTACYWDTVNLYLNISNSLCGKIKGQVFVDNNNNCFLEAGEPSLSNYQIKLTDGINSYFSWTDNMGNYAFNVPNGTYTINFNSNLNGYAILCNNSLIGSITTNSTTATIKNFALSCNYANLQASWLSLHGSFFPGTASDVYPIVDLFGTSCSSSSLSIDVTQKVILPPCLHYAPSSNSQPPNTIITAPTGDTLVWQFTNNNYRYPYPYYGMSLSTCTNVQVGDTVCISLIVSSNPVDGNLTNNTYSRCFEIGVSYDPNTKDVSPAGIGSQGYIPNNTNELTYTIHFQNTGTATAHNIYVLDTLSNHIDAGTLEIISTSHPMQPYMLANNTVKFMFANIMLADSTHNEPASHGFVIYKIKPKTNLANGIEIKNTGYIYFDYNTPIKTNTALNTIGMPLAGLKDIQLNSSISIFPNPSSNNVNISSKSLPIIQVKVMDMLGREVLNINQIYSNSYELNAFKIQTGNYLIEITTADLSKCVKRFVKMNQ